MTGLPVFVFVTGLPVFVFCNRLLPVWFFNGFCLFFVTGCCPFCFSVCKGSRLHWKTNGVNLYRFVGKSLKRSAWALLKNWTFALKNGIYLKQASPKAANIHNRWLSCRRQRSLRFKEYGKIVLALAWDNFHLLNAKVQYIIRRRQKRPQNKEKRS